MYSKLLCAGLVALNTVEAAHVLVRRDGAHGHSHGGQSAPAGGSGYAAPAAAEPAASYGAPAQSYQEPSDGYGAPAASYDYGTSGYGEEEAFPISTLIIPILIIAGLSLLFPTITTVSVNRKRRHAEDAGKHTFTHFTTH